MTALAKVPETITLRGLCVQALADHGGDAIKARLAVVDRLRKDSRALNEIVGEVIAEASRRAFLRVAADSRRNLFLPNHDCKTQKYGVLALAEGVTAALLDFPLSDGTLVRKAGRSALIADAERREIQANTMLARSRWLRLLAQCVPDGKTVGDVMDDARAVELWNEAVAS